jgi:hypothetical protein
VLVVLSVAAAAALLVHGIALVVIGAIFCASAAAKRPRARSGAEPQSSTAPAMAGHSK